MHPTAPSRTPRHTDRDRSEWDRDRLERLIGIAGMLTVETPQATIRFQASTHGVLLAGGEMSADGTKKVCG